MPKPSAEEIAGTRPEFIRKIASMIERDTDMPNDVALHVAIAATDAMITAMNKTMDMEEANLHFKYVLATSVNGWWKAKDEIKTAFDMERELNRVNVLIAEQRGEPVDFKAPCREMAAKARRLGMDEIAEGLEANLGLDDAEYYRQFISAEA